MVVIFDFSAEGMNDLDCENYVPTNGGPGWHEVIGNIRAAQVAMERFNTTIIFNGVEYDNYGELNAAVSKVLSGHEA